MEQAKGQPFPVITVCPRLWEIHGPNQTYLNETYLLQKCGISVKEYLKEGRWQDEQRCPNGQEVFEAIIPDVKDFIKTVEVVFLDTPTLWIDSNTFEQYFVRSDTSNLFRCYTSNFPKQILDQGIVVIQFRTKRTARIHLHSHGMFFGPKRFQKKELEIYVGGYYSSSVDNEVYQVLDLDGEACNQSASYDRDACIKKELNKVYSN